MPNVIFKTNIDKFKDAFFNTNYDCPPRIGEFVKISDLSFNKGKKLPFDELEVKKVTWTGSNSVEIELHLSELQAMQNISYKLKRNLV